jgi:concanavalin A-like lectin/glucanase superfamily protein
VSLRTRWLQGVLSWYESVTDETILALAPVWFCEDFLGAALDTTFTWTLRDTAGATEALVADASGGILELALTSANEAQLAGVDWGNQRTLDLSKNPVVEARIRFTVLPTGSVVAVIGLCGDHNAAVNTVAESAWFRLDGSGAITVEADDTVHETSLVATGVTLIANQWTTLRIELDDASALRFYIDGARVAAGTTFNFSQVAALALQPVARIGKESAAATVGTLQVDAVKTWQART